MIREDLWEWKVLKHLDFCSEQRKLKKEGWKVLIYYPDKLVVVLRKPNKVHLEHCRVMKEIKNKKDVQDVKEKLDTIEWWKDKF